jgi:hypothetical protein
VASNYPYAGRQVPAKFRHTAQAALLENPYHKDRVQPQ